MRKSSKLAFLSVVTALSLYALVLAADPGTDDASGTTYAQAWNADMNGATTGSAFTAWRLFTNPSDAKAGGFLIGDSTSLGGPGADINTDGKSFGLFGGKDGDNSVEAAAYRDFSGNGLGVGQTFSADLAVNYRNGFKGLDLRSGTEAENNRTTLFTLNIGGDDYVVSNAATGNGSIGNQYDSKTTLHVEIAQTTAGAGTWKVTRGKAVSTGTYTGTATGFKFYCGGTDGNNEDRLFFNHLSVTR